VINKIVPDVAAALAGIEDGATIMIGGFGGAGQPAELIDALIAQGAKDLVIVNDDLEGNVVEAAATTTIERSHLRGPSALASLAAVIVRDSNIEATAPGKALVEACSTQREPRIPFAEWRRQIFTIVV
jgi:acyl CoA:acetate/3-ketoacid CoA transferase alpha subunit